MHRNGHLPAGRGQGGPTGPGMGDMAGERHGNGTGGGGGGGRGGGRGRGRHYGSHYQNQHHQQHYHNNQHHNQHHQYNPYAPYGAQQPQMYPPYMNSYAANPYVYAPMQPPFTPNGAMPAFVPYQQQPYGRQATGLPPPFYPMTSPNAMAQMGQPMPMHGAPPMPVHMSSQQQPPPPQQQQQQQQSAPSPPSAQQQQQQQQQQQSQQLQQTQQPPPHMPMPQQPHMSPPYARPNQQAPLIVSTPAQSSSAPSTAFDAPPLPASMGLPPAAPFHMSLPLRPDVPAHIPQSAAYPPAIAPLIPTEPMLQMPQPAADAFEIRNGTTSTPVPQESAAAIVAGSNSAIAQGSEPAAESQASSRKASSSEQTGRPASPRRGGELSFGDMPPIRIEPVERAPLPRHWTSVAVSFPPSRRLSRRRRRFGSQDVELPRNPQEAAAARAAADADAPKTDSPTATPSTPKAMAASVATTDTDRPSDSPMSTSHSSIGSAAPAASSKVTNGASSRPAVPALPVVRALPAQGASSKAAPSEGPATTAATPSPVAAAPVNGETPKASAAETVVPASEAAQPAAPVAPAPARPVLWTGLFSKSTASAATASDGAAAANGNATNGTNGSGGFAKANSNSLAEALASYRVDNTNKVAFIEPRGLINTGNMCYMNSVLQALAFCIPFYDFLDQVGKKAAFSFKSETPIVDAMIMFLREFKVIDRADPIDLQRRLKSDDVERYGEAFIPEIVYDAINKVSRFSSMRRGHQQDAEEFLGFLLDSLTEECTKVMQSSSATPTTGTTTPEAAEVADVSGSGGWLEVGPRQRAAVTRSSGHTSISPVNSIFGGQLRSELRVPGLKDSVTLEPYLSLQLHIDSPEVRNIVDALQNLTKPETLQGNFNSPHGKNVSATKQVFIENLPPVLILHLKRFQFDAQGGTVKIWKKVGYPLELEIPREIFARRRRNAFLTEALPKYRLHAVIYHHGKHANGGHYTVDVLREDSREWIRMDDTVLRRIRSDDVAAGGEEESGPLPATKTTTSASAGATAPAVTTNGSAAPANRFAGIDDEDAGENDAEWRQVYPTVNGSNKKWSAVATGSASATAKAKQIKESAKDSKVAYLLFYQRIN